jgi:hypothetical protein
MFINQTLSLCGQVVVTQATKQYVVVCTKTGQVWPGYVGASQVRLRSEPITP